MKLKVNSLDQINWYNSLTQNKPDLSKITVWDVEVSPLIPHLEALKSLLSIQELEKSMRYKQENDRQSRIISKAVLKILLGRYTGIDPKEICFSTDENKKPRLKNTFSNSIHFNVSHGGNHILIVIADEAVGVDLEKMNASFTYQNMLDICFSLEEINSINQSKFPYKTFYKLWTRKECLLKATGQGLIDGLNQVPSLDGLHPIPTIIHTEKNWQISSFNVDDEHIASAAFCRVKTALQFFKFQL